MGGMCVNSNVLHISQRAVSLLLDLALLLLPAKLLLTVPVGRPTRPHFVLIFACGLAYVTNVSLLIPPPCCYRDQCQLCSSVCGVSAYWTIMSPSWMGKLIEGK